jgi:hypothetical protein
MSTCALSVRPDEPVGVNDVRSRQPKTVTFWDSPLPAPTRASAGLSTR